MKRASSLFLTLLTVTFAFSLVSGLAFAEEDSAQPADFDLKSRQPIMSPPGCPIGPIMPAGRPQQYGIEEVPTGHSPKSCSIKDFLFPWTRESD